LKTQLDGIIFAAGVLLFLGRDKTARAHIWDAGRFAFGE
jgi:hypothetical protein